MFQKRYLGYFLLTDVDLFDILNCDGKLTFIILFRTKITSLSLFNPEFSFYFGIEKSICFPFETRVSVKSLLLELLFCIKSTKLSTDGENY